MLSPWGEWSSCSQTCVTSNDVSLTEKTRYRHVAQEGSHGGVQCPLNLNQIKPCDLCKDDKKALAQIKLSFGLNDMESSNRREKDN